MRRLKEAWSFAREVVQEFMNDRCPFLAAGICYFAFFSLFPLFLGLVALLAFFLDVDRAINQAMTLLGGTIPLQQQRTLRDTIESVVNAREAFGLFAAVVLLWAGKNVFISLGMALDMIWRTENGRGIWPYIEKNIVSIILAIATAIASVMLSGIYWGLRIVLQWKIPLVGLSPDQIPGLLWVISNLIPIVVVAVGLLISYRYLPSRKVGWRQIIIGSSIGAILWDLLRRAFGFYLEHFNPYNLVYGSLSGIVVFMLWIYLSAMVFLLGAEIAGVLARRHSGQKHESD